jgi:hypothetical protein
MTLIPEFLGLFGQGHHRVDISGMHCWHPSCRSFHEPRTSDRARESPPCQPFAVVSTDPGAFSQNSWIAAMKAQMQAKYPKMQLVDIRLLGEPAE